MKVNCSGKNPKISIIVPVYNAEKYLANCLDTLIGQTYENFEIICVNDGSTDDSLSILRRYIEKDSRIQLIDKVNGGVSQARNIGLQTATGEYIMFVDADDWISRDTCLEIIGTICEYRADVVMWTYMSENEGTQSSKHLFSSDMVFDEYECKMKLHRRFIGIIKDELAYPELADSFCPVWGKLYSKELIDKSNARFVDLSEIGTYEDGLFNLEVFGYVKKVVYLDRAFYHYRRDNTASVTHVYRKDLFNQWQNLFSKMAEYIEQKELSQEYRDALNNRIALSILGLGLNILEADCNAIKKIKMLKKILKTSQYCFAYQQLPFKYFPIHWRIFYGCAKLRFAVPLWCLLNVIHRIIQ